MEALKTAIVGCGKVGHLHAKALSRTPKSPPSSPPAAET